MTAVEWLENMLKNMIENGADFGEDYPALLTHIAKAKAIEKKLQKKQLEKKDIGYYNTDTLKVIAEKFAKGVDGVRVKHK